MPTVKKIVSRRNGEAYVGDTQEYPTMKEAIENASSTAAIAQIAPIQEGERVLEITIDSERNKDKWGNNKRVTFEIKS